jgi:molybdate transport system regulatory protein
VPGLARLLLVIMATPRLRIRIVLANGGILGPTKIALLEAIETKDSISAAARSLEISYRTALQWVESINGMLRSAAVVTERGGRKGGAAALTPIGARVLELYRTIESRAERATHSERYALGTIARARPLPIRRKKSSFD